MTDEKSRGYASPPCFAHELEFGPDGYQAVDPDAARDVARWRKAERERLLAARLALSAEERRTHSAEIVAALDSVIDPLAGVTVSVYWPFRGEPDLRAWMSTAHERGARIAMPAVVAKGQPLVFREWEPGCRMVRGVWNIFEPAEGAELTPDVTIAPVVGVDREGYRLGYGGGYYDRTLAALSPRPRVIGVGHPVTEIATIFPQPHDIPMDVVVTGAGRIRHRARA